MSTKRGRGQTALAAARHIQASSNGSNKKKDGSGSGSGHAAENGNHDTHTVNRSSRRRLIDESGAVLPSPSPSSASTHLSKVAAGSGTRPPSPFDALLALTLLAIPALAGYLLLRREEDKAQMGWAALTAIAAYVAVVKLIPIVQRYTMKRSMSGKDLNKPGRKEDKPDVPESQGVVSGVVYVIVIIFMQLIYARENRSALIEYNAALHSIGFMLFLGFADDVVDLPWRYKLILPSIASLPLLVAYSGSTWIAIPKPFIALVGGVTSINLGILYQVYMGLLAVFCTNAINIFAGINGLEAGQSFVIGVSILLHNLVELGLLQANGLALAHSQQHSAHLFSALLLIPFLGVTLGLLKHNWYPSRVFVGDTFCYFAGMTFAVTGILGHFSKTLLLFFLPQIFNFLYSVPQIFALFGLTCPRHRLPKYNPATDKLEGVPSHHNLLNLWLLIVGPQHERTLCRQLLAFQVACSALAFLIRYWLVGYFFY